MSLFLISGTDKEAHLVEEDFGLFAREETHDPFLFSFRRMKMGLRQLVAVNRGTVALPWSACWKLEYKDKIRTPARLAER